MRVTVRPFSDLLRHPKDVTSDIEEGDVLLRRRDEPDLRLTRADREAERTAAFAAFGRTLRNMPVQTPGALEEALIEAFPWLEFLPHVWISVLSSRSSRGQQPQPPSWTATGH